MEKKGMIPTLAMECGVIITPLYARKPYEHVCPLHRPEHSGINYVDQACQTLSVGSNIYVSYPPPPPQTL